MTTASDLVELAGREAIAPCPFCGGEAQALDFKGTKFKPAVSCTVCPADMPARTMAEAITAWNRRAALRERIPLPADGEAREALERAQRCLGFFASVIKSGEAWSDTCEREYRLALHPSSRGEAEQK